MMKFIKYGGKSIPVKFNARAAQKFEEEFEMSYTKAMESQMLKYLVPIAWYAVEEGYRQQGKDPAVTIDDFWDSDLMDEKGLLVKVLQVNGEIEKKP